MCSCSGGADCALRTLLQGLPPRGRFAILHADRAIKYDDSITGNIFPPEILSHILCYVRDIHYSNSSAFSRRRLYSTLAACCHLSKAHLAIARVELYRTIDIEINMGPHTIRRTDYLEDSDDGESRTGSDSEDESEEDEEEDDSSSDVDPDNMEYRYVIDRWRTLKRTLVKRPDLAVLVRNISFAIRSYEEVRADYTGPADEQVQEVMSTMLERCSNLSGVKLGICIDEEAKAVHQFLQDRGSGIRRLRIDDRDDNTRTEVYRHPRNVKAQYGALRTLSALKGLKELEIVGNSSSSGGGDDSDEEWGDEDEDEGEEGNERELQYSETPGGTTSDNDAAPRRYSFFSRPQQHKSDLVDATTFQLERLSLPTFTRLATFTFLAASSFSTLRHLDINFPLTPNLTSLVEFPSLSSLSLSIGSQKPKATLEALRELLSTSLPTLLTLNLRCNLETYPKIISTVAPTTIRHLGLGRTYLNSSNTELVLAALSDVNLFPHLRQLDFPRDPNNYYPKAAQAESARRAKVEQRCHERGIGFGAGWTEAPLEDLRGRIIYP